MVSQVSVIGGGRETDLKQASIKFRLNRNPVRPLHAAACVHTSCALDCISCALHLGWPGHMWCGWLGAGDWRQILIPARAEGCALTAVARRRHAIQRSNWHEVCSEQAAATL